MTMKRLRQLAAEAGFIESTTGNVSQFIRKDGRRFEVTGTGTLRGRGAQGWRKAGDVYSLYAGGKMLDLSQDAESTLEIALLEVLQ